MCGIGGVIGRSNLKLGEKIVNNLRHRGPDKQKVWTSKEGHYPITLSHARLSVIDLSEESNQPFLSKDGRYAFVYNGEIYNYIELKKNLENKGYIFKTSGDTEVLLYGLIDEGISFFDKCNGMWALCLWDQYEKKATFARDRFGIKPLFYSFIDNGMSLAFASEMKALTILQEKNDLNTEIDISSNFFDYENTKHTIFKNILRLPPGTVGYFQNGNFTTKRWWNTLDNINFSNEKYSLQVDKWRNIFFDSVKLRMRSDIKIGTALSGGLDSSSIVAVMNHLAKDNIEDQLQSDFRYGICCSFPGSNIDELNWAKKVANSCNINFINHAIDPQNSSWDLVSSLYQTEDPYLTIPIPMLDTYQAIKRKGISVTLDGHGSDELFSGYGHIKKALFCTNRINELNEILQIHNSSSTGIYSDKEKQRKRDLAYVYAYKFLLGTKMKISSFLEEWKIKTQFQYDLHLRLKEVRSHQVFQDMDPFTKILYEIFDITVLPTLLRNYDRYSMASGVEVRMPFMDWRLVTYTFSLPWQSKIGGSYTKRIQRDALEGILINDVRQRRDKVGWNSPSHEWFKGSLNQPINQIFKETKNMSKWNEYFSLWQKFLKKDQPLFHDGEKIWCNSVLPVVWQKCFNENF